MKLDISVVDSGPIIKGADLTKLAKHVVIVPGVIREIKDVKTRERIRNLPPYFLSIQTPLEKSIKQVRLSAKATGDIKVLSTVDIEVIAMTYEILSLKTRDQIELMFENFNLNDNSITGNSNINDFFSESQIELNEEIEFTDSEEEECSTDQGKVESHSDDDQSKDEEHSDNDQSKDNDENSENHSDNENLQLEVVEEDDQDDLVTVSTMPVTDDEGWITAENFEEMRKTNFGFDKLGDDGLVSIEDMTKVPTVACLTTDYAMQNVLLHMGIPILSINGMIVKEPRIFVSYCRTCFRKYRKVDLFFCPHCGNDNIGRVPAKIHENGEMELFLKKNFQPNNRNKIFSIPTPKGGKHVDGTHYIYCADQRIPHERQKKSRVVVDVNEDGPLPFIMNDINARSSARSSHNGDKHGLRSSAPRGNKRHNRRK